MMNLFQRIKSLFVEDGDIAMNERIDRQVAEDRAAFGLGPDTTARVLPVVEEEAARPNEKTQAAMADASALLRRRAEVEPTTGRIPNTQQRAAIAESQARARASHPVAETPRRKPVVADVSEAFDLRSIKERTK